MVSVVALTGNRQPVAFTQTDERGAFHLALPEGNRAALLSFRIIGYAEKRISLSQFRNGQTVWLKEEATDIREVVVKSGRIRQRSDTLSYSVAGFRQKQDRSIADVIGRMPGMSVSENGTISYQGKAINKLYVEGMDLMGGKYAMTTENLPAIKVKNVEVYRHHQPVKALKNIQFSDQAALNLVLTDEAKNVWNATLTLGAGCQLQSGEGDAFLHQVKAVAMVFGKQRQSLLMYKDDNTGKDIRREVVDLAHNSKLTQRGNSWLSDISVTSSRLKANRTSLNDTRLLAANWLKKTGEDRTLRLQSTFLFDKSVGSRQELSTITNVMGQPMIEEDYQARKFRREWSMEAQYLMNAPQLYINNVAVGAINWNTSAAATVYDGLTVTQCVKPRSRFFGDELKVIKKTGENKSVSVSALFRHHYRPGLLSLLDGGQERLNLTKTDFLAETGFRHKILGMYVSYTARVDYERQRTEVTLTERAQEELWHIDGLLTPSVSFKRGGVNLSAAVPLRLSHYVWRQQRQDRLYADPQIAVSYQIDACTDLDVSYRHQHSPYDFNLVCGIPYYMNYYTLRQGTGQLGRLVMDGLGGSIKYGNPVTGFFVNFHGNYSIIRNMPLFAFSLVDNVYTAAFMGRYTNNDTWNFSTGLSKAFGFGKLVFALDGSAMWRNYDVVLSEEVNRCRSKYCSAGIKISVMAAKVFSIDGNSTWQWSRQVNRDEPSLNTACVNTFKHELKLYFTPGRWQLEWGHELYHGGAEGMKASYFSDLGCKYRKRRWEVSLSLNNIFGTDKYESIYIGDTSVSRTVLSLRPAEMIASVRFSL